MAEQKPAKQINFTDVAFILQQVRNDARRINVLLRSSAFDLVRETQAHKLALGVEATIGERLDRVDELLGVDSKL